MINFQNLSFLYKYIYFFPICIFYVYFYLTTYIRSENIYKSTVIKQDTPSVIDNQLIYSIHVHMIYLIGGLKFRICRLYCENGPISAPKSVKRAELS